MLSIKVNLFCSQIFVKNLTGRSGKGGRKKRLWLKGSWKHRKMEVGEGSADRQTQAFHSDPGEA